MTSKSRQHLNTTAAELAQLRADAAQRADALAQLEMVRARATRLEAEMRELAVAAQMARGTRDLPVLSAPAEPAPEAKSELYRGAERALLDKPHTFRDLCAALKVPKQGENSLKSVLMRLQRDGLPLVNLGNGSRAIWWIDQYNRIAEIAADGAARMISAKK